MSGKRKIISIVAIGIMLSAGLIAGVTVLQLRGLLPQISTTTAPSTSSSLSGVSSTTASSLTTTSRSTTGVNNGANTLILQLHDPPHVPPGVTSLFISFSDIWISSFSPQRWIDLRQSGKIDLMSVVNFTQTISNSRVENGTYNLIVMNITSAIVTSYSQNYTASLPSNQLSIPIVGGLRVSNATTVGAVIDISPTVIQYYVYNSTGSRAESFAVVPSASAYAIPTSSLDQESALIGHRDDLNTQSWLTQAINQTSKETSFVISSAAVTNSSFFVSVRNTGNRSIFLQSVFLMPFSNSTQLNGDHEEEGLNIGSSVLFTVLRNGTLLPYPEANSEDDYMAGQIGYNIPANSQVVFSYWGSLPPHLQTQNGEDSKNSTTSHTTGNELGDAILSPKSAAFYGTSSNITTHYSESSSYQSDGGSSFSVVAGQKYIVGATSGDVTSTIVVTAT